jgi:hypothetical protein
VVCWGIEALMDSQVEFQGIFNEETFKTKQQFE